MHPDTTSQTRPEHTSWVSDPRVSAIGAPNGAKYRTMSPAKLPISRSPCLTVPPGLSPGALLDSPVLLNNIMAEASPTTGTFSFHSVVNNIVSSNSLCSPSGTCRNSAHGERSSGNFEFKTHIRASSCSSLSSFGHLASGNPTQQGHESSRKIHPESHSLECSQSVQAENTAHSSHALSLLATDSDPPIETLQSEAIVPDNFALDELQHTKGSDNSKQALQCDNNGLSSSIVVEKSSEDGYNWRKYGQKHVKGCEFPRSYYKCTHDNCQVKKLLERSHDGQITEIIYKGQHNHPKPEPNRRLAFGTILSGQGEERSDRLSSLSSTEEKLSNADHMDPHGNIELFPASPCDEDVEVGVEGSNHNGDEVTAADDPESKRRKVDNAIFDATQISKTNREPRVVVQTISEVDILDDGYRWRKYGQKVVKGNPNPRSYYKCTNAGCSVRKHVERASHDPKAVITTYEGKHNHAVPARRNSSHDTARPIITIQMPTSLSGRILRTSYDTVTTSHLNTRPEATDTISLDLGVGISTNHNSSSNGLCVSREGNAQGFSFRTSSHSYEHYYSNSGNLVMGP